jgi:hypothetical protein
MQFMNIFKYLIIYLKMFLFKSEGILLEQKHLFNCTRMSYIYLTLLL